MSVNVFLVGYGAKWSLMVFPQQAVEMVVNGVLRTLWVIVSETRCTCTKRSTLKEETNVNHTKGIEAYMKGIEAYMAILQRMGHAMDGALHGRCILWSGD